MALQSSGPISLNNIATEFGGSTPHLLSEYYGVATGIPSSGTISFNDFYGASSYNGPTQVNVYVISGGGGGGNQSANQGYASGGGGGARRIYETIQNVSPGSQCNVAVGGGGSVGGDGGNSTVVWSSSQSHYVMSGGQQVYQINGVPGGRGGYYLNGVSYSPNYGGGGAVLNSSNVQSGVSNNAYLYNDGAAGFWETNSGGGGGGGGFDNVMSSTDGPDPGSPLGFAYARGGKGSDGFSIAFSSYSKVWCTGGGGGTSVSHPPPYFNAPGGSSSVNGGVGAHGYPSSISATAGAANTGAGGGGAGYWIWSYQGGSAGGGSGVVVFAHGADDSLTTTTGSPTKYTHNGWTYYVFTGTGTITFN